MNTKAIVSGLVALTAVLAAPAFTATAYAQPVAHHERVQTRSVYGTAGQHIGSDPDPFIRSQLARDPGQGGAVLER
jgi:hypothetical protein